MRTTILIILIQIFIGIDATAFEVVYPDGVTPPPRRIATPVPYSEISIDSIQKAILTHEIDLAGAYDYGQEDYTDLKGFVLRTFKVWTEKYTRENIPMVVFEYQSPEWVEPVQDAPLVDDDDDDDDGDGEDIEKREREYVKQYTFELYPRYENCDVKRLLSERKILVNINGNRYPFWGDGYSINIVAYIPLDNTPQLYKKIAFRYEFQRYYKFGDVEFFNRCLINGIKDDPYYVFNKDGAYLPYFEYEEFEWGISKFEEYDKNKLYTIEEMPTTVEGLFGVR